jgi:hypothetical protein
LANLRGYLGPDAVDSKDNVTALTT